MTRDRRQPRTIGAERVVRVKRGGVCLVTANPLALMALRRMLRGLGLRVREMHFELTIGPEGRELRVPKATVYVLDACSTGMMTEAIVAGILMRHPGGRMIIVATKLSESTSFSLLQLGVKGLLSQRDAAKHLVPAVHSVASGGVWMPRVLMARFLDRVLSRSGDQQRMAVARRLSQREREVLDCVLKNQSNKEISSALHISESTVKFHIARLFQKFGVRRRADLILQSVQQYGSLLGAEATNARH